MERTKSGTIINCGIEYNELPPPKLLVKAMEKKWADPLIKDGLLRIRNIKYFKEWENKILGDPNDGKGLYYLKNHPMQTGLHNDVYAWCLSLPKINSDRINLFAKDSGYDCLVILKNPEMLFKRIKNWFSKKLPGYWLHCGLVNYDRGKEVDKKTLNSQKFLFNVFQKASDFEEDFEYRLSITNTTFFRLSEEYIDLSLGDCRDILSIEKLPNMSLQQTARAGRRLDCCSKRVFEGSNMNLKAITRIYTLEIRPLAQAELDWFQQQPTLRSAIEYAALAINSRGKRYSHQRRLKKAALEEARRSLLMNLEAIARAKSFDDLFSLVETIVGPISGIGELYVYDTSLRIGARLHLLPTKIYLHAGTRVGAQALGFGGKAKLLEVSEMPLELRRLVPHEIEDVLCIFKADLKAVGVKYTKDEVTKRSWCG